MQKHSRMSHLPTLRTACKFQGPYFPPFYPSKQFVLCQILIKPTILVVTLPYLLDSIASRHSSLKDNPTEAQ